MNGLRRLRTGRVIRSVAGLSALVASMFVVTIPAASATVAASTADNAEVDVPTSSGPRFRDGRTTG